MFLMGKVDNAREARRCRTGCPEKHGRKARKGQDPRLDRAHCVKHNIRFRDYMGR